jgi:UDP-glucose:(heptosyl)LPS alpha-1,3-glucosyltransferase
LEEHHFARRDYRKIIATTPEVREDLNHYYGVPAEDVVVIPNGFAPTEFNPERRRARRCEMRERLGLDGDQIALLFVANELERKGYGTILDAMRRLGRPDLRLLVVGRPDVNLVRQRAAEFGLSDQVIACGSTADVSAFHAAGDVFVLPTQYEAFCLAILEALGSGLPVVTTRVPGAHDAIIADENGLLIDDPRSGEQLAAALQRLCDGPTRARMTANAAESVREYQWPTVLRRYERVLEENCG